MRTKLIDLSGSHTPRYGNFQGIETIMSAVYAYMLRSLGGPWAPSFSGVGCAEPDFRRDYLARIEGEVVVRDACKWNCRDTAQPV